MTDDEMLDELGLARPTGGVEILGIVNFVNGSWVEVKLHPKPIRFWTFTTYVYDNDKTVVISTGTGDLAEFWPFVELYAEGMISVDPLVDRLSEEVAAAEREAIDNPLPPKRRMRLYRQIARAARESGEDSLHRSALQMAWDARREFHRHPAE